MSFFVEFIISLLKYELSDITTTASATVVMALKALVSPPEVTCSFHTSVGLCVLQHEYTKESVSKHVQYW